MHLELEFERGIDMEKLLPYLPQLISFALRLGNTALEISKEATPEDMQRFLDMAYEEIAVKKRLKQNENGKWIWN